MTLVPPSPAYPETMALPEFGTTSATPQDAELKEVLMAFVEVMVRLKASRTVTVQHLNSESHFKLSLGSVSPVISTTPAKSLEQTLSLSSLGVQKQAVEEP